MLPPQLNFYRHTQSLIHSPYPEIAEMLTPARLVLLLPILLVACDGTFPLFSAVDAPAGITAQQQVNDISSCTTQAEVQASKSGERIKAFFSGSAARENDRVLQRRIFAECMTAKGYTVVPVQDAKAQAEQQIKPVPDKRS